MTRHLKNATGYVDEIPYTPLYIKYQTPFRLACVGRAKGFDVPNVTRPFRYLDLGCGPGKTLNILADIHPKATFVGVDLNPDHVHQARDTAQRSGLDNVTVHLADFASFLDRAECPFDFIAVHGVYSWVSEPIRAEIDQIVARSLAPNGVLYLSYFDAAGAGDTVELFELVRNIRKTLSGPVAETTIAAVKSLADSIATHPERFPNAQALGTQVKDLLARDHRYLIHEFGNETLAGIDRADLTARLAQMGLQYAGDARRFGVRPAPKEVGATTGTQAPFRRDVFSRAERISDGERRSVIWSKMPLETLQAAEAKVPSSGRTPEQAFVDLSDSTCRNMLTIIRQCQDRGKPLQAHSGAVELQADRAEDAITRLIATGHVTPLLLHSRPYAARADDRFRVPSRLNRLELSMTPFIEGRADLGSAISGEAITLDFMDSVLLKSMVGNTFAQAAELAAKTIGALDDDALLLPVRVKRIARSDQWLSARATSFRRKVLPRLLRHGVVEIAARSNGS